MKVTGNVELAGRSIEVEYEQNPQGLTSKIIVALILALLSTKSYFNTEILDFTYVTTAVSIMLAVYYGRSLRTPVIVGMSPLIISSSYILSSDESVISFGLGGGPIGLYLANILIFEIISSATTRKQWLCKNGILQRMAPLIILASFFYPVYNPTLANGPIGFDLSPKPLLLAVIFWIGYSGRNFIGGRYVIATLFLTSLFASYITFDFPRNGISLPLDFLSSLTYSDLGLIFNFIAAYFCGHVIRHSRAMKNKSSTIAAFVVISAALVSANYISFHPDIKIPSVAVKLINGTHKIATDQESRNWPPDYEDSILREVDIEIFDAGYIEFGEVTNIDTSMGVGLLFFTAGYLWLMRGALVASLTWMLFSVVLFTVVARGPAVISDVAMNDVPFWAAEHELAAIFFYLKAPDMIIDPTIGFVDSMLFLSPDFVFAFFGAWLGIVRARRGANYPQRTTESVTRLVSSGYHPAVMATAWTAMVFLSHAALKVVLTLLSTAWVTLTI